MALIDDYFLSLIHSYVLQANGDARFSRAGEILDEVTLFRILEPAVGCGNFLYTAYTHLSRIESYLHRIMAEIQPGYAPIVRLTPSRMIGYEINSYSAMVSRMVMAIADFEIRRTQFAFPLPLSSGENSVTIIQHDSLLDGDEIRDWHEAEIIIGNPPFMGLNKIRQILGVQYADRLNYAFGELAPNVNIDYVCYFILLASRMVEEGNCRAFGFITTHAVGGPINRAVIRQSLNNGLRIPFAYRRREWVGDAGVSISIFAMESPVNRQVTGTRLASSFNGDIVTVDLPINEYLDIRDLTVYTNPIPGQSNLCFQSVKGSYKGRGDSPLRLVLTDEEAEGLLALANGEDGPANSDVVVRYVGGKYAGDRELGWILNFRAATMEEAARYVHPFQFVYDTRRLGVLEWINPEYQENPGPLGVSYSPKAAEYNMQDRWWTIRDHCEAQFGPLREMATNFYLKHQTYAREARSHLIHIEQVPNNYTPDGTYYVFNFGDHETWRVGVLLSGYYGQWSSVTQGWTDNFGSTWRPGESFNGFPFPQDPSLQRINSMNEALEAYYNRIAELEGQFDTFQQVLNAAALLPFRNAIDQVVQTMYGFPNDDQVLSNLTDYKARVLLITERNTLQESLQTLTTVPGLGEATVQLLTEAGVLDYHQLIQVGVVGLQAVDGIGPAGATRYVAHATEVLNRLEEINQLLNQHEDG